VVRAIVAFFALSHAISWQQDNPLLIQRLDPLIQKIVSEVSQERIAEILKKLESFETRNTLSDPGYIVVVRSTTEPDWQREIWVGNVREFTLKNTPIDQLVFGVKSVDRDGHESPVSAYWTQPRPPDQ
jgi:hypothetical protein